LKIERAWAMPNKNTFSIAPIKELITSEMVNGLVIDPFANSSKIATITNDIDPQYKTDYNLDALDFLKLFETESIDMVLFDPPYSVRQVSEVYTRLGKTVNMETTQATFWTKLRSEVARVVKPGGKVVSCGWNSMGIGKNNGFKKTRILLVPHGGVHNDTIVVVEEKTQCRLTSFSKSKRM